MSEEANDFGHRMGELFQKAAMDAARTRSMGVPGSCSSFEPEHADGEPLKPHG